jgi:hypothetical protein
VLESGDDAAVVSEFKSSYVAHKWELDRDRQLELAGRSMAIAGGMLDGIGKERHLGTVRAIRVAPLGHLLRGFAKVRRRVRGGH